jgi:hypothetical protein
MQGKTCAGKGWLNPPAKQHTWVGVLSLSRSLSQYTFTQKVFKEATWIRHTLPSLVSFSKYMSKAKDGFQWAIPKLLSCFIGCLGRNLQEGLHLFG